MKTSQERTGGGIAPVGLALAADQPVPVGYLRVAVDRVVNVSGFLREVMGSMAENAINGTHDERMQQVLAAAVAIEIARSVSPALGGFMESLCFQDEGQPLPCAGGMKRLMVRNDGSVKFDGMTFDIGSVALPGKMVRVVLEEGRLTVWPNDGLYPIAMLRVGNGSAS